MKELGAPTLSKAEGCLNVGVRVRLDESLVCDPVEGCCCGGCRVRPFCEKREASQSGPGGGRITQRSCKGRVTRIVDEPLVDNFWVEMSSNGNKIHLALL